MSGGFRLRGWSVAQVQGAEKNARINRRFQHRGGPSLSFAGCASSDKTANRDDDRIRRNRDSNRLG